MPDNTDQVTVVFVHPTDSTQQLTATVGVTSTPRYLITELVRNNFMPAATGAAEYKLVDLTTSHELADNVTLAAAKVAPHSKLAVLNSVTGAMCRRAAGR